MADPRAETNRLQRVSDGEILANLIDDCRNYPVSDSTRKKQLVCYNLVLLEVLLWETFVEDVVDEGQDFLLNHVTDPTLLGYDVLLPVSEDLAGRRDRRLVWRVAGHGWRTALREHRRRLIEGFHTPRPDNVDALLLATLGIPRVSQH